MSKPGAHVFTITTNVHAEAVAALKGGFHFICPHTHVSGRRCATRVIARNLYCDDHQRLDRSDHCADCHAMMDSFRVKCLD